MTSLSILAGRTARIEAVLLVKIYMRTNNGDFTLFLGVTVVSVYSYALILQNVANARGSEYMFIRKIDPPHYYAYLNRQYYATNRLRQ